MFSPEILLKKQIKIVEKEKKYFKFRKYIIYVLYFSFLL